MKIEFGKPFIDQKERNLVNKILKQPILVHGRYTEDFERNFCSFTKSKYAVSVSSCTAGLHMGYLALGIREGDEVIVTSQSHVATAHAIEYVGAKPIFVDCDLKFGNIDINLIESKITKKTKAISIVHFLGMPVDMIHLKKITKKYNLFLIEDCALAVGAKIGKKHVGTFGDIGSFSFYPVKHITTIEGGMITTQKKSVANFLKKARAFGYEKNQTLIKSGKFYDVDLLGLNYRMNEVEAGIGIEQLKKINKILQIRTNNSNFLRQGLKSIKGISLINGYKRNFINSNYCVSIFLSNGTIKKRKYFMDQLKKRGITSSIYYPGPIPNLKYYKKKYDVNPSEFKNASIISNLSIALPVGPHLKINHMKFIIKSVKEVMNE